MNYRVSTILTILIFGVAFQAFAKGPGTSGGGDVAILPDDTILLADPFVKADISAEDSEISFSNALQTEIKRGLNISSKYFLWAKTFEDQVYGKNVFYYSVDNIPSYPECKQRLDYQPPSGVTIKQVACTIGNKTWIKEDLFKKMNVREQALLLFHEALRRVPNIASEQIVGFTNGLRILYHLYNTQMNGQYITVNAEEKKIIRRFIKINFQLSNSDYAQNERNFVDYLSNLRITDHGGMISEYPHSNNVLGKDTVIGVGALLGRQKSLNIGLERAVIEDNVVILMSQLWNFHGGIVSLRVGSGSKIINSEINWRMSYVGRNIEIIDSVIEGNQEVSLDDNLKVVRSKLQAGVVRLGKAAILQNISIVDSREVTVMESSNLRNFIIESFYLGEITLQSDIDGQGLACETLKRDRRDFRPVHLISSIEDLRAICKIR